MAVPRRGTGRTRARQRFFGGSMSHADFNFRNPSVNVHKFAMIPNAQIPRSQFRMQHNHKTTISASYLYPVFLQEVLPGDSFNVSMTAFSRLSTPIVPIMDNMVLTSFFFFVPNRLVWKHWVKFMGEQDNPGDSISYGIPQIVSPVNGFPQLSLADYFGLPTVGQTANSFTISVSALPFRAYAMIYHQWFRDENLVNATWLVGGANGGTNVPTDDDGPDAFTQYTNLPQNDGLGLMPRLKRHDYFTGCLPWTQKATTPISIPFAGNALVKTSATETWTPANSGNPPMFLRFPGASGGTAPTSGVAASYSAGPPSGISTSTTSITGGPPAGTGVFPTNLYADLSTVTATTINALRLAFQTQKLLERDARGGTRYTEIVRSHFGVLSPDSRLQRAEYLGGGTSPVNITPVAQTAQTGLTGGTTPLGTLGAVGTNLARGHGFRQSFTEHGHIIGLVCVTADLSYQQGIRRLWSRQTRYDFYFPVFAMLGEQGVLNKEIFSDGSVNDSNVFGYQERWAEYRYMPSLISGFFRSTNSTPLDFWHLSQKFATLPSLGSGFIVDPCSANLQRCLAAGANAQHQQLICDFFFDMKAARPLPMYSVPGMIDHF